MARFSRIVIVTKRTHLQDLLERFVTEAQARFYLEHMGLSFSDYEDAHTAYAGAMDAVVAALPSTPRHVIVDRALLPMFAFEERDLVVTLGGNGLVVNVAKYLDGQPLVAVNPDPRRHEAILVPFRVDGFRSQIRSIVEGRMEIRPVTMAEARLNDGQILLAFNDLFVGRRDHASARYRIEVDGRAEEQSSSGVIISTGAGSTGWLKSIVDGALRIVRICCPEAKGLPAAINTRFDWSADWLRFAVREPFTSSRTGAGIIFGVVGSGEAIRIISRMPEGGVIFSDGVFDDAIAFNSGAIVEIRVSARKASLVSPQANTATIRVEAH